VSEENMTDHFNHVLRLKIKEGDFRLTHCKYMSEVLGFTVTTGTGFETVIHAIHSFDRKGGQWIKYDRFPQYKTFLEWMAIIAPQLNICVTRPEDEEEWIQRLIVLVRKHPGTVKDL
jgi:hypothetical protein